MEKLFSNREFKIVVLILIILIIVLVYMKSSQKSVVLIEDKSDFSEILNQQDIVIIDVRSENEYNERHILKAINIPYNELNSKVKYDKKMKIVVYSKNDARSHMASTILEDMGYTNIYEADMTDYDGKLVKS